MNVIKAPEEDTVINRPARVPTFSPRRTIPRQIRTSHYSPSPQRYENINRTLGNLYASIDAKYIDAETNKILFMKITNEFGQQLISMVSSSLTNVNEDITDVPIKSKSQISYPEHLSEFIKAAGEDGFGLANETPDGMIIVLNTEVIEYKFDRPIGDGFKRERQYIVTKLDTIVENLQPLIYRMYSSIHKLNNITQSILFNNMHMYKMNINYMNDMIDTIVNECSNVIKNEIHNISQLSEQKRQSHGSNKMEFKEMLRKRYECVNDVLESLSKLDHHLSQDKLYETIDACAHELRLT